MNSTRLLLSHLKEYNYKLCRKGLLERGLGMNIYIGEFKALENDFMKTSLLNNDNEDLLSKLNEAKRKSVKTEVEKLEKSLEMINRTVRSIKEDVKSRVNEETYGVWLKRMDLMSVRFKSWYSNINNDQYDHWYKLSKKTINMWKNVSYDIKWIKNNVCNSYADVENVFDVSNIVDGFVEGDLSLMFNESSTKENSTEMNSSGQSSKRKVKDDENHNHRVEDNKKKRKEESQNETKSSSSINELEDNDLQVISYDELSEDELINQLVVVDEVGEVDLQSFDDLINQVLDSPLSDE